jgi:hypothetical protein
MSQKRENYREDLQGIICAAAVGGKERKSLCDVDLNRL